MSQLLLFQAGLVAACIQSTAAGTVTFAVFLAVQHKVIVATSSNMGVDAGSEMNSLLPLLQGIYVLIALGVSLTDNRFVDFTAARIRHASRLMCPTEPDHATKSLLTLLTLGSIGFSLLALRPPPHMLFAAVGHFGTGWVASAAWSGMMSVAAAAFGANAQATRKAL